MFRKIMKNKSIFSYLLVVMCILVLIETTILVGSLSTGGMFAKLNQNAKDIVDQRVINRSSYLQNEMLNNWSNLSQLTDHINTTAKQLVSEGKVDYEHLDDSSETATPLILAVVDQLISTMRSQHVTGAYIIFNNHDLDKGLEDKPGIYLRDLDPLSKASAENGDLLIERAPTEVVKSLNIATDSSWRPRFEFKKANIKYYDFFYTPYQQAISNSQEFSSTDIGYCFLIASETGDSRQNSNVRRACEEFCCFKASLRPCRKRLENTAFFLLHAENPYSLRPPQQKHPRLPLPFLPALTPFPPLKFKKIISQ